MTEAEWNICTDPWKMLDFLHTTGRPSERKRRLFAVACCRRIWHLLADVPFRQAVELSERFADGAASREDVEAALGCLQRFEQEVFERSAYSKAIGFCNAAKQALWGNGYTTSSSVAGTLAYEATGPFGEVEWFSWDVADPAWQVAKACAQNEHTAILRDIFGNPFRPVSLDPAWLAWNDGAAVSLAQTVYDDRDLPSGHLDAARLAVLADMLEEAGATDAELLGHLRGPGPHVRGCHSLDLVLGKS